MDLNTVKEYNHDEKYWVEKCMKTKLW